MGDTLASLGKWSLLGAIGVAIWLLGPVAVCSFQTADNVQLRVVSESDQSSTADETTYGADRTSDVARVSNTQGFFNRFFGSVSICYARTPLSSREPWQQYLLYGLGGGGLLLLVVGYATSGPGRT